MAIKSKVEQLKLQGKCMWSRLNPPGDEEYEHYNMAFYPNEEALKLLEAQKLKTKQRKDAKTGEIFYSISRKFKKTSDGTDLGLVKLYTSGDELIVNERPHIVNGSLVTIKVITYPIQKSNEKAIRLEAVRIDEMASPQERDESIDLPF
jgi:hypothetical protein